MGTTLTGDFTHCRARGVGGWFLIRADRITGCGNTIRLNIENRREEIEVSQLVGATTAYVRRPFLYGGVWYGFFGGVLSLVIVHSSLLFMIAPVNQLAKLYGSHYSVTGLGAWITLVILVSSSLLGLVGAWIAMAQHLRRQHTLKES